MRTVHYLNLVPSIDVNRQLVTLDSTLKFFDPIYLAELESFWYDMLSPLF